MVWPINQLSMIMLSNYTRPGIMVGKRAMSKLLPAPSIGDLMWVLIAPLADACAVALRSLVQPDPGRCVSACAFNFIDFISGSIPPLSFRYTFTLFRPFHTFVAHSCLLRFALLLDFPEARTLTFRIERDYSSYPPISCARLKLGCFLCVS